jgi:hypothetical protein
MSHFVIGIVGKPEALEAFAEKHSLHLPIELSQGFSLLPLRDRDIASFVASPLSGQLHGFNCLSEQLLQELRLASSDTFLVYFETEYFGGMGAQGAVALIDGQLAFGPESAEFGTINRALALLGVAVNPPAHDELEAIGLNRHRQTEHWVAESRG